MPTTMAQPEIVRERSRPAISSVNWEQFLSPLDPLAEWRERFANWREEIQKFREGELKVFFPNRDDTMVQRVHRGWLGLLISNGEHLAVDLLQSGRQEDATDELKFLDLCLENLQSTLATWHAQDLESVPKAAAV